MNKTWKPIAAGTLDIAGGIYGIIIGLLAIYFFTCVFFVGVLLDHPDLSLFFTQYSGAIVAFITGILAVVGGIYAFRRKRWGWALTGAVAVSISLAISPLFHTMFFFNFINPEWSFLALLGLAPIVLTVLSKKEFEQS